MPNSKKRFIIRKYIMAHSAAEALKIERKTKCDEVWIDPDWIKEHEFESQKHNIGYGSNKDNKR